MKSMSEAASEKKKGWGHKLAKCKWMRLHKPHMPFLYPEPNIPSSTTTAEIPKQCDHTSFNQTVLKTSEGNLTSCYTVTPVLF